MVNNPCLKLAEHFTSCSVSSTNESQVPFSFTRLIHALETRFVHNHVIHEAVLIIDVRSGRIEEERVALFTQAAQGLLIRVCEGPKDIITKMERNNAKAISKVCEAVCFTKFQTVKRLDSSRFIRAVLSI